MKSSNFPARRPLGAWASPVALLIAFVVALALIVASAVLDLRNDRALARSNRSVSRTLEALEKLRQTSNVLYVAESSLRGYVITGKAAYLEPYRRMRDLIAPRVAEAGSLVSDTPQQREDLAKLKDLANRKFAEMDRSIEAMRIGGRPPAVALIDDDIGAALMTEFRAVVARMLATEGRLLTERRDDASTAYSRGQTISFASNLLIALALCVFYLLMHRYWRERDAVQRELQASNAALERRVEERTAELAQLSRHLLNVREGEKKSIARDLHDEFGSYLTAINMDVSRVRDKIAASSPEQAARLERTLGLLGHAIEMKRRLVRDLRPSILDNLGLGAALEQYIDDWSRDTGISTTFKFSGDLDSDEEGCPIAIFRVFQEALQNVAKHSGATEVSMAIRREGDQIVFEIADDGSGITEDARARPGAHGLLGIRERVLAYHGKLDFTAGPRGGTTIRASVQCPAPARSAIASAATGIAA